MNYQLFERYPDLQAISSNINVVLSKLEASFQKGGILLAAGNGGSCADADHLAGELLKGFMLPRRISTIIESKNLSPQENAQINASLQRGLPVIPLSSFPSFATAYGNDENPHLSFAQLVYVFGRPQDVFLGISTSGNSKNILYAAAVAKEKGMTVVGLTGRSGGRLANIADECICVPATSTPDVQELHLPIYHYLCAALEDRFFGV
ncbi:MAG: D-sedoheptulose-7-phosphate isomerase [Brevinema sp.]